jgi:hypothetical protein
VSSRCWGGASTIITVEDGWAWSLIIAKETGKMSATVADDEVGFAVFGACTPF